MLDQLSLLDWKRQVFGIYAEVRATPDPAEGWRRRREVRDELFARHAQSPLPEHVRKGFQNLDYFDYDPACRVIGTVSEAEPKRYEIGQRRRQLRLRLLRFGALRVTRRAR
jgi:uncharacterized protein